MTATNHVVTGILIASTVHIPAIALPLAFVSHFLLDSLPHYASRGDSLNNFKFKAKLATDMYIASLCLGLVLLLNPAHAWILVFGGILAASPDLMWIPDFINALKGKAKPIYGPIRRFHSRIQWYQKPKGIWVEAAWFLVVFIAAFGFTA